MADGKSIVMVLLRSKQVSIPPAPYLKLYKYKTH